MSAEPTPRPYGDAEPARSGGVPHLSDYWQVVSRRLWLVLVIFTITTASSIWAVSRQRVYYQGHMALQIHDPLQRQRGLVTGTRVSGMDIYVDPIQSEIQVLESGSIAAQVVDSVGLRLQRVPSDALRSQLVRDVWVADDAPDGGYQLAYDASGRGAELRTDAGKVLGSAPVGGVLDAGFVRFTVQPAPDAERVYPMSIVPASAVEGEVSLAAAPRQNTNIIDVSLVGSDPVLIPKMLNQAGLALREQGAEHIRQSARADVEFINQQLDSARRKLKGSLQAIENFEKTRAFASLSDQERQLVQQQQQIAQAMQRWDTERSVLSGLVHDLRTEGIANVDLVSVLTQLQDSAGSQVRSIIGQIRDQEAQERQLLTQEREGPSHPQVLAVRAEIQHLARQLSDASTTSLGLIESHLKDLAAQQAELRQQQSQFPELEGKLQSLQAQQTTDRDSYQFLVSQLYQAQITLAAASPYIDILDPAVGASPIRSRGRVNVFLGALLGLILGIGAAFFLEYLDRTVRTSSDVESLLGIPVLGVIPRLRRIEEEGEQAPGVPHGAPLVVALDPLDPAAEAYRNLRMNLMFMSTEDEPIRTLLFSSPGPAEGKSTTAVNFAVMLAQQGQRVLLLDADLRRPSLHRALDVLREPGLTNLLIGDAEAREAVRPNVLPNLDFLPSGPFPPNPSELLNSKTMVRILEEFEGRYDQIIIDSPPLLAVTDAAILAVHTDGAVLVLRSGETEQRAAERSVDQLRRLGVRVFGAVLNEVSAASPDESYYLQYYYSYQPSGGGGWKRLREGLSRVKIW